MDKKIIKQIEKALGYMFINKRLLIQAFTRSSYHYEHLEEQDNEELELMGDSVLSLIVINSLSRKYIVVDESGMHSSKNEGELSKLKSALVNKQYLAKQMSKLSLQRYLRMSKGDELQGIQNEESVLEDLFESIVGAVYIDTNRDLNKTSEVIEQLLNIEEFFKENDNSVRISYKNDVQEWCQKNGYVLDYNTFQIEDEFISQCEIMELEIIEEGSGHNKKEAENNAAERVMQRILSVFQPQKIKYTASHENAINVLQEYCQAKSLPLPIYKDIDHIINRDNSHTFTVGCLFGTAYTEGDGKSKKEAKKQSAYNMMNYLGLIN